MPVGEYHFGGNATACQLVTIGGLQVDMRLASDLVARDYFTAKSCRGKCLGHFVAHFKALAAYRNAYIGGNLSGSGLDHLPHGFCSYSGKSSAPPGMNGCNELRSLIRI